MGRFEKRPDNPRSEGDPFGAAETALRAMTEELQIIQRNLLKSLQEDVKRLQAEKFRLAEDIQQLQENRENLQNRRQIGELQELVRQLAQLLANHISSQLQSSLNSLASGNSGQSLTTYNNENYSAPEGQNPQQVLGNLDHALNTTLNSLQQELNNYESSFSMQLTRMSEKQQQAETILAELVNRLRSELEKTSVAPTTPLLPPPPPPLEWEPRDQEGEMYVDTVNTSDVKTETEERSELEIPVNPSIHELPTVISPPTNNKNTSTPLSTSNVSTDTSSRPIEETPVSTQVASFWQRPAGFGLIVLSTVVSSLYNVAIKAIFQSRSEILGVFEIERLVTPTLGNSLLILMLRMLVVVPLMLVLAPILHPRVWQDLQNLTDSLRGNTTPGKVNARRVLLLSMISGGFLFLSQVLIYIAIGQIQTGIAIALLFIYPVISGLLSWFLFRDRLNLFRMGAIATIILGELLVLASSSSISVGNTSLGTTTAIASGVAFAFYVILTRICAAKLHPVSFTLINFVTMLVLSFIGLMLPYPQSWSLDVNPNKLLDLVLSAFILGVITLIGYLLNNFGIRKLGATRSAIIGATVPALTVILAGLIIQENILLPQILGILIVTGGAAAFNFEKMRSALRNPRATN